MNKMIKGSIAGATGIALLMGGFGTYALWSDSQGISSGTVQSGTLDIVSRGQRQLGRRQHQQDGCRVAGRGRDGPR